jgi:hypothetical protein
LILNDLLLGGRDSNPDNMVQRRSQTSPVILVISVLFGESRIALVPSRVETAPSPRRVSSFLVVRDARCSHPGEEAGAASAVRVSPPKWSNRERRQGQSPKHSDAVFKTTF